MLPAVDLTLFLPFLEQRQVHTDARENGWLATSREAGSRSSTATARRSSRPRVEALDGWLEGMWSEWALS